MLYPQTPIPDIPLSITKERKTLITELEGGIEYRRRLRFRERRFISLQYRYRKRNEIQNIIDFFNQRKGAFETFTFEVPYVDSYTQEYVGRGDGVTTTFTLPFQTYSALTVYIDGTVTTSYTVNTSTERATITFNTAPATNSLITCDFTGKARWVTRFAKDTLDIENLQASFVNLKVELVEVLE